MWVLNLHPSLYGILIPALFKCCHQVKKPMLVLEKQPLCDQLSLSRIPTAALGLEHTPILKPVPTLAPDSSSSLSGETLPMFTFWVHGAFVTLLKHMHTMTPSQPCQYICSLPWLGGWERGLHLATRGMQSTARNGLPRGTFWPRGTSSNYRCWSCCASSPFCE